MDIRKDKAAGLMRQPFSETKKTVQKVAGSEKKKLNEQQIKAVRHREGPCLVVAGPGSGKTYTMTMRIAGLLSEGASPSSILVVTFTKYAAVRLKEGLRKVAKEQAELVCAGTFHRIFFGILRQSAGIGAEHILTDEEKEYMIEAAMADCGYTKDDRYTELVPELAQAIGNIKNETVSKKRLARWEIEDVSVKNVFETYERRRVGARKMDYDDIALMCRRLLEENPAVRRAWQNKFSYIMIDEFQDINKPQYETVLLLLDERKNIFAVGDDDQAIYGFRGADVSLMLSFAKDFPQAAQLTLGINYRSTKKIVESASRMVRHNRHRFRKKLESAVCPEGGREEVRVIEAHDVFEQSKIVYRQIRKLEKEGVPLSDIAVLYRIHAHGRVIVSYLSSCHLPIETKEIFPDIHDHFIFRDLFAYMELARTDMCRRHLLRIVNRPNRYISRESLSGDDGSFSRICEQIRAYYFDMHWMWERVDELEETVCAIRQLSPAQAVNYIRKVAGYDEFLARYSAENHVEEEALFEVADLAADEATLYETFEQWKSSLNEQESVRGKNRDRAGEGKADAGEAVQLMSMHSAKGLEFHTVFVIDVTEGSIPYKKAQTEKEIEEERRLFYVAMTRAKRQLFILTPKRKNGKRAVPSRFIKDLN